MPSSLRPLQVRPTDPYIRWVIGDLHPDVLVREGANVAWIGRARKRGEVWATGLGDDDRAVAGLIERLAADHDLDGVTVPEQAFTLLPERLRSPDPGHWCLWLLEPAAAAPAPSSAVALDLDDPRIAPLLAHSDSAYLFPGDPHIVRWAGVLDGETLVSVAGQVIEPTGAAHLVSVCTHPAARGRGLARDACSWLIAAALDDGAPMIMLEMYVANVAGRRAYTALGFVEVGRYRSGLLREPPRPPA